MNVRKVLLLSALMVCFIGFSGTKQTSAGNISEQCKADLRAAYESCKLECPGNLRCFVRCLITNFPASCR
jgi:hypothetical protein